MNVLVWKMLIGQTKQLFLIWTRLTGTWLQYFGKMFYDDTKINSLLEFG
jgi:hypothetical protein